MSAKHGNFLDTCKTFAGDFCDHASRLIHPLINIVMARNFNTNVSGGSWTKEEIDAVWAKATYAKGLMPIQDIKVDAYGRHMKYSEHGNRNSEYGWEVDHIKPVAKFGTDDIWNLQPLNWKSNVEKGDYYLFPENHLASAAKRKLSGGR